MSAINEGSRKAKEICPWSVKTWRWIMNAEGTGVSASV